MLPSYHLILKLSLQCWKLKIQLARMYGPESVGIILRSWNQFLLYLIEISPKLLPMLGHCLRNAPEKKKMLHFFQKLPVFQSCCHFHKQILFGFCTWHSNQSPVDFDNHMLEILTLKQLVSCAYMIHTFG